jgi:hypothetical protein
MLRAKVSRESQKIVPGVGTIAALAGLYADCQAKGLGAGLSNSGLDAVPWNWQGRR